MESARFLIVGGGMTGDAAVKGIRERDPDGPHRLEPNRKGTVAYVDEARRPRGLLFWNVWDRVERGRELVGAGSPIDESDLVLIPCGVGARSRKSLPVPREESP